MTCAILAALLRTDPPRLHRRRNPSIGLLIRSLFSPEAASLRDDALANDHYAWDVVEGLTTEIGPRLAGTEAEARARAWAVRQAQIARLCQRPRRRISRCRWCGSAVPESALMVLGPDPQHMVVAALGNSASTGPARRDRGGRRLRQRRCPASRAGFRRSRARSCSSIITCSRPRTARDMASSARRGARARPSPRKKAAQGIVVRSIGPITAAGPSPASKFQRRATPIPAAALSVADAEKIARMFKRGKPVVSS